MTDIDTSQTQSKVNSAIGVLLNEQPFLGYLALNLTPVAEQDGAAASTDGEHLFYSEEAIDQMPLEQVAGLVGHEASHCALLHLWRRAQREPERWNIAADIVVNGLLAALVTPRICLLDGALRDEVLEQLSTEEVYDRLPEQKTKKPTQNKDDKSKGGAGGGGKQNKGNASVEVGKKGQCEGTGAKDADYGQEKNGKEGKGQGQGGLARLKDWLDKKLDRFAEGACRAAEGIKPPRKPPQKRIPADDIRESDPALEKKWEAAVQSALNHAAGRGDIPASIRRAFGLAPSQVNWRSVLSKFIRPSERFYSFHDPDVRYGDCDVIMPDLAGEKLEDIVIALDSSGSIDKQAMDRFLGEVRALLAVQPNLRPAVCVCDAAVQIWEAQWAGIVASLPVTGGGGTDFRPVFDEVRRRRLHPASLVFFTDGDGAYPEQAPPYPVLWVLTSDYPIPWGHKLLLPPP